jgi:hypothetical protein
MSPENQFEVCFSKFLDEPINCNYVARDSHGKWSLPEAIALIRRYTELYIAKNGQEPSVSAFKIVRDLLLEDQMIVRSKVDVEEQITLTADEYRATPIHTVQGRYKIEPAYRDAVDRLHAMGVL